MTTIVTRLYATADKADSAAAALRKAGFTKLPSGVVKPSGSAEDALKAILALGVYQAGAKTYAARVADGASLVVVHAPFGKSFKAKDILDDFEPIAADVRHTEVYVPSQDPPNWTSKHRYLPILFDSDVLVLSDGLFPPAIIKNARPMNSVLTNNRPKAQLSHGTISEKLGIPLLTKGRRPSAGLLRSGTPFSSALGIPTLTDRN